MRLFTVHHAVSLNPSHRLEAGEGATYLIIIDAAFEIGHREQQSIIWAWNFKEHGTNKTRMDKMKKKNM